MSRHPETNRRQFLTGESAREQLGAHLDAAGMPHQRQGPAPLMHLSRQAMACTFSIFLDARAEAPAVQAAMEALDLLEDLEDRLSIYRPHSEISRLNQAGGKPVRLSPEVFALLQRAHQIHTDTEGAFDITAGPLARVWGFAARKPRRPAPQELAAALAAVGLEGLALDPHGCWAQLERPDMEVNLGGIGKGYALDRCRQHLHRAGVTDFLMHGGLSSVLASGSRSGEPSGWRVEIKDPVDATRVLTNVRLDQQALGTSGAQQQYFIDDDGQPRGHIIDPRSGQPAIGSLSVTAVAPDAATADALATACYILGPSATETLCERQPTLGAIFVREAEEGLVVQRCGAARS